MQKHLDNVLPNPNEATAWDPKHSSSACTGGKSNYIIDKQYIISFSYGITVDMLFWNFIEVV